MLKNFKATPKDIYVRTEDLSKRTISAYELSYINENNAEIYGLFIPTLKNKNDSLILYIHGYASHLTLLVNLGLAWPLIEGGYSVAGIDIEGHGKSNGKRGSIRNYNMILDDYEDLITKIPERFNQIRNIFLIGHSMGGSLGLLLAERLGDKIKGLITVAPLLGISSLKNRFIYRLFCPLKLIKPVLPNLNIKFISINMNRAAKKYPVYEDILRNDTLITGQTMDLSTFVELDNMRKRCIKSVGRVKIPTLFIHGKLDEVTCYKETAKAYSKATCNQKKLLLIENGRHYVLLHTANRFINSMIVKWMNEIDT